MPATVTMSDILIAVQEATKAGLHVSLPGRVESYDEETQTASVKPTIRNPIVDTVTGDPDSEEPVVIPNVMVIFPRGGGFHCSFPLVKGDHVVLVFSELATAQWRVTGEVSEAVDVRRQSLAYPFAIPGAFPDLQVLKDRVTYKGKMVLGKDGDPTGSIRVSSGSIECGGVSPEALALASKVVTALQAVVNATKAAFTALPAGAGGAGAASLTAAQAALNTAFAAIAATITKGQ